MGLTETLILLAIGFVTFFATGIDDTVAYAGTYLNNKRKDHKKFISLGIIIGTFIALSIAIFAGSLMAVIPYKHLVGGGVLMIIGIYSFTHRQKLTHRKKAHFHKIKKHLKKDQEHTNLKFVMLGMTLFFATGIDDIIAYSNLIMAKGSWLAISIGVVFATFISLIIASHLSDKLKNFPHPERIGGGIIIIIGILLALKIL